MFEDNPLDSNSHWEAGFEGDRRIVVSVLGPYRRVFPRPNRFIRRFYHRVYELKIEDWQIPLEPLRLGTLCTIEAELSIRFQPTIKYAHEHLDHIANLGAYIRANYLTLLQDAAEHELRQLEQTEFEDNHVLMERRIENIANELLAMREIQCRTRCTIRTVFAELDNIEEYAETVDAKHNGIYLELVRRRRQLNERLAREHYERETNERKLKLEHEERMLELIRREAELRKAQRDHETEHVRAELTTEETRAAEQYDSEVRLREARIHHETRLKQLELEADLAEKTRRAGALDDVENQLKREIELLALERQRLLLEEEIHDVKIAKAKGWVINAKRRFPLGENSKTLNSQDSGVAQNPGSD
ncbi:MULTISPECIES: coiled-coil domain-containing protein [Methylocaldum]|jgi:hypothetical protein|uniref:hypothetical protein n=1 Tax=unclassified Methylocaldum TaxID=2622260 RepID=UPI000989AB2E|nr:hypothetical protein [Methylocaldum sp. 14B]MDV3242005.1 hypothetical protein [Methylocaldum sp.]MVF20391.1 hypothetical protein [Methylocaldum sp. BRCS4]